VARNDLKVLDGDGVRRRRRREVDLERADPVAAGLQERIQSGKGLRRIARPIVRFEDERNFFEAIFRRFQNFRQTDEGAGDGELEVGQLRADGDDFCEFVVGAGVKSELEWGDAARPGPI